MTAISASTTFKGADDDNKSYKRSADVAYGAWRAKKDETVETKKEFENDLGVSLYFLLHLKWSHVLENSMVRFKGI